MSADVSFADLTILTGPQASGKSLLLEVFKLVNDYPHILSTLRNYSYALEGRNANPLLEVFFGEGLSSLLTDNTQILHNDRIFSFEDMVSENQFVDGQTKNKESVFYMPAQRILSMPEGRPRNFTEFDLSAPYVLRLFSEVLRLFLQGELRNPETIFPMGGHLEDSVSDSFNRSIFHDAKVVLDEVRGQRLMKLKVGETRFPFMTWSAGQKEFMPLLLGFYYLSRHSVQNKANMSHHEWVVIEEPEMGLHPQAIESVILEIVVLLNMGYKVVVSTHSPVMLEFAWAFQYLKNGDSDRFKQAMCELFHLEGDSAISIFDALKSKTQKAYYLSKRSASLGVTSTDISTLDVCSKDEVIADWGGLSSFAGRAMEVVGRYGE